MAGAGHLFKPAKVGYYEGADEAQSGHCLLPEFKDAMYKAPFVYVLTASGVNVHEDVPVRAEGGGHTIRPRKKAAEGEE